MFTASELMQYNGQDPAKPIYMAVKGTVFDISEKRGMYGVGQTYNVFTGRDASRVRPARASARTPPIAHTLPASSRRAPR